MKREQELKEAAIECYGDDVHLYAKQRDGFKAGAQWEADRDKWISCKDRLPENRSYVLAYTTNGGYTSTAEYKHGCWFKGLDRLHFVTHWQELPKKPIK